MLGSAQAQQLAAALDPAPTGPRSSALGNPSPKNLWQAGFFAEDSPKRPISLYAPVSFSPDLRPIIFFLLGLRGFPRVGFFLPMVTAIGFELGL